MRIRIRGFINPGSGVLSTLDPGWKKSDPGSGINIPDPQHWFRPLPNRVLKKVRISTRLLIVVFKAEFRIPDIHFGRIF